MTNRPWFSVAAFTICSILLAASAAHADDKLPVNPKLFVKPPARAIVLFDGKAEQMHDNWYARRSTEPAGWTVDDQGVATPNHRDITSKQEFGDCYLHVEFCEPMKGSGNSGVGMEGRYEIQILNSYGKKPEAHECGSLYGQIPPKVIASKPAGEWQTFDIFFRAPRFDASGKLTEKARATVYQNGTLVQDNQEFKGPTGIQYEQYKGEVPKGPIVLQGDHDTVQFRNVWLVPADTAKAEPEGGTSKAEKPKQSGDESAADKLISQSPESAKYRITINYTEAPELGEWVKTKLQPTCDEWYPKIIEMLPSQGYKAPEQVTIDITSSYPGVAATAGTHVMCNTDWFKKNLKGEAPGAVVHELVHVVQQFHRARGRNPNPGWLVEGIPDYIRWFKYEPKPTGTRPRNPETASYTNSYRITAGFLNFVIQKHDKDLVRKLNAAMRQGKYSPDLWKDYTGKSVDDLWKDYVATLR